MEINTTGKNDTNAHMLGRGKVYGSTLDSSGFPTNWRFLGNCTEFTMPGEVEELEHYSTQEGNKTLDRTDTLSIKYTYSYTLDEINEQNLAEFYSGDYATYDNAAAVSGITEWEMVPAGTLVALRSYDLRTSAGLRALNVPAANVTVKTTNVSPVTLVLNTDYEVDVVNGTIFVLNSTAVGTAITAGEGLDITVAATAAAGTVARVTALTATSSSSAIRFVGVNPATGLYTTYNIHKTKSKPDGDFSLISDDWTTLGFTGTIEKNTDRPTGDQFMSIEQPNSQA